MQKTGKIIPHGVKLEPHELDIVLFYTNHDKDVELIIPSNTPHVRRPDFYMDNLAWEAKSPHKNHRRAIERIFYNAARQSNNIIIDLRHVKDDKQAILILEKCFKSTRKVRNLQIITKSSTLKTYKK